MTLEPFPGISQLFIEKCHSPFDSRLVVRVFSFVVIKDLVAGLYVFSEFFLRLFLI
jgi:hypothetical protein